MRIAIVDDEPSERSRLRRCLDREWGYVEEFDSGENFLEAHKLLPFQVVFLDIYMNGITGLETAGVLRRAGENIIVIFTTTSRDHALEGYRVRALHYLVKPYTDQEVHALLREIKTLLPGAEPYLDIRTADGDVRLLFSEILYAENYQHRIYIKTLDGMTYIARQTFGEFSASLTDSRFFLCSRGVIVNMEHAEDYDGSVFLMRDGKHLPVSRNLSKDARRLFADFLFERRRRI